MKIFARIVGGKVAEIIAPMTHESGKEIPVENRFHPALVAQMVEITQAQGVEVGDLYDGTMFSKPVAEGKSVATLQADKNTDINSWRDRQENAPILFQHAGRTWDGGLATRRRLDPVASLPSLPDGFFWTDANNNDVEMTLADIQALRAAHEAAIVEQGFRIHIRQRTMKQEIEALAAADDAAGIEAYVIGWEAPPAGTDDE